MTKKKRVSKTTRAVREYNRLLHKHNKLRILAENIEWLVEDLYDENPIGEKKMLQAIWKKKKKENNELEARFISCWIRSIKDPVVDEEILKFVH